MITFIIGIIILFTGYLFYSRYIDKVFAPDDRPTPAHNYKDNVDYIPLSKNKNTLSHLLNSAGMGPIIGAIQGILFGPIAFLIIFVLIIKAIIESSKLLDDKNSVFLMAVPYGFFQLFFSDSLLLNVWFFLLIGLILEKRVLNKQKTVKGYLYSHDILHVI